MPTRKKTSSKSVAAPISKFPVRNIIIAILMIVLVAGVILLSKNQLIAATVNGEPITRLELIRDLEKRSGRQALESMVTQKLILQEAAKKKVEVSQKEANDEISKIEKEVTGQGQNLDLLLSQQNLNRAGLAEQIKLQLLLKKMVGKISVSEKEIADFIEQNKDAIGANANSEDVKKQAQQQLEQQKLNDKIQTLIQDLQKKAKIEYLLPL